MKYSGRKIKLDSPPSSEGIARRFLVTFCIFPPHEKVGREYTVCTVLGQQKALAMAAGFHEREHPDELIYDVVDLRLLDGDSPMGQDIVDRMEW